MPEILDFKGIRLSAYDIILRGKKIGEIVPNSTERKKSFVSFETDFEGNKEIAKTRLIDSFFDDFLPSNRQVAV